MKKKLYEILEVLGLKQKFEDKALSNEEWQQIVNEYQQKYSVTLQDDVNGMREAGSQQLLTQIYEALASASGDNGIQANAEGEVSLEGVIEAINSLGDRLQQLAQQPAEDQPAQVSAVMPLAVNGPGNTREYLFGIEAPMFSMQKRWNQIAANPRAARSMADADDATAREFYQAVHAYGRSLQQRFAYLQQNAMLDARVLESGEFSNNYEGVANAGLGDQYVIRRQDALIARVLKKRDLTQWFPVRYGVQDRDLLFNTYFGELSQAYQKGEIYKGDMKIENEMGYVDDAMIKIQFGPMKELERMYIAYLNRDGSDPIKWSMIEYCLLNELETAQVEQNKRRVRGIYVKPETGVAGSAMNAGTGLIYTLLRYYHDYSIKLHDDADYRSYTSTTMLAAVQAFVSDVTTSLSEDMDLSQHVLYLNERHKPWWIKNIRDTYHLDQDFTGPQSLANRVPDTDIRIVWLPYLGSLTLMLLDVPGNLQFVEYIPGEMLAVKMEEQMEMVRAWSTWKEGCGAAFTGRKFNTKEALDKNAYEWQQIFMNKPCVTLEADAATPDGKDGFWFETAANTAATAISDIANAKAGVAYVIECGSADNATTIAKSGKFANLKEPWEPTAVGDYIMVILGSDGNFRELERRMGGTRTVNTDVQPNTIGGR